MLFFFLFYVPGSKMCITYLNHNLTTLLGVRVFFLFKILYYMCVDWKGDFV